MAAGIRLRQGADRPKPQRQNDEAAHLRNRLHEFVLPLSRLAWANAVQKAEKRQSGAIFEGVVKLEPR
jgi:hypothetical protein